MTQTLVFAPGASLTARVHQSNDMGAHNARPPSVATSSELTPQQMSQLQALADVERGLAGAQASTEDVVLADLLAPLASHHHMSEYNQLKHGPRGCDGRYVPLSIQLPAHINALRSAQLISCQRQSFFSSANRPTHAVPPIPRRISLVDQTLRTPAEETPPIPPASSEFPFSASFFSSETPAVSAPLESQPPARLAGISSPAIQPPLSPSLEQAISLAMSSSLPSINTPAPLTLTTIPIPASVPKTSQSHPINIAAIIPPELIPLLASRMTSEPRSSPTFFTFSPGFLLPPFILEPANSLSSLLSKPPFVPLPLPHLAPELVKLPESPPGDSPLNTHERTISTFGNILLSSCPGKKVRLSGVPKTGRGAICRDLHTDLARIKSLGVRCIINCLDDEELHFLGAPWEAYVDAAGALGIDVVRCPMPEGLSPVSCEGVDEQLRVVIEDYTSKGVDVLVHCRGGVGRAGLIACCWMIKMGLCGSVASLKGPAPLQGPFPSSAVLSLVESAIRVVRRRRSLKAIETFEQVKFLVRFVEYLVSKTNAS